MDEPKLDYNLVASEFRRILDIAEATEPFTVESDAAYKRLGLFCSAYGEEIERGIRDVERLRTELRQIEACVENDDCPDLPLVTRVASAVANLVTMIGKWVETKEAGDKLLSCVLTVRKKNTEEWMHGIAEDCNAYAEATGEADRVEYVDYGMRIIRKKR